MTSTKAIPLKAQAAMSKFEGAREALRAFERTNARLIEDYTQLRGSYNSAIEEVKETYRDNHETLGQNFGDFALRYRIEVDGQKLAQMMGDKAIKLGLVSYEAKVDRKKYDRAVSEGLVPAQVIAECETQLPPAVVSPKKAE